MTRTTAKYLALLALTVVIFHWKTLLTDQFTSIIGSEGVDQTYAWLHFWVRSVWRGHLPLWDPYQFAGRPFAGEMQTAAFYPLRLLFALIRLNGNDMVSFRFFHVYLAFNRFLGAVFMFALLREFKRSHFAAFVGSVAFSMGGLLARMSWPQYMESCIWLPAVFFFFLRSLRAEGRRRAFAEAAAGGLCIGMSLLTGGVQFSMMQMIAIGAAGIYYGYGAVSLPGVPAVRSHWVHVAAIVAVILAVAFCVGAAQLLPAPEYSHLSIRAINGGWFPMSAKIPYDRMDHGMWPQSILSGFFAVGGVLGGGEAWPYYIGVFPMFLAITAIWKCWRILWVRYLTLLAVFTFIYTLGEFSPLNGVLYAVVPYLWMVREPSRFVYLISFALAVLAAFGLDSLLEGAGQSASWAAAKPFLKCVAIACAGAVILPGVFTQITFSSWLCLSLLLIIASCGWFLRLALRPAPASLRVMLAAFILFDLGAFNWLEASRSALHNAGDRYEQMITLRPAVEFIKGRPGLSRLRVEATPEPNVGDIYAVEDEWGGGATVINDFSRVAPHEDLWNVRYHIRTASTPDPGAIYQDALWKVYEDKGGFERAWVVHKTIVEPSHDAVFDRLNKPGSDFHNVAIVERALPDSLDATASGDSLRFRSYEPDEMSLDVNAGGSGLLVLSEVYYPGWRATVNGARAEIYKVDGALRGVVVPAGASHVVLEYVPLSEYLGAGLSFVTVVGVIVGWILLRRKSFVRD